jgi:hypothetical protein
MTRKDADFMVGQTIDSLTLAPDGSTLTIEFRDETGAILEAEGECCSHCWIEGMEGASQVVGHAIVSVEDIEMPERDFDVERHECLDFYGLRINTNFGALVIDYRNSNNGYYGGWLNIRETG